MLVDCNIREAAAGDSDDTKFDVKQDLLSSLKRNADNKPFVDVFVLTHGDQDHCRGFSKNFYQADPAKYSAEDRKAEYAHQPAIAAWLAREAALVDEDIPW